MINRPASNQASFNGYAYCGEEAWEAQGGPIEEPGPQLYRADYSLSSQFLSNLAAVLKFLKLVNICTFVYTYIHVCVCVYIYMYGEGGVI
jgi:hypothetical protein